MKNVLSFSDYDPELEYKSDTRREMNLNRVRRSREYKELIKKGFKELTSEQQELNSTMKFQRVRFKEKDKGHDFPFYTIHPSGTVRRYNPPKSPEVPEGSGNYIKGIQYLLDYLDRKEDRGDYK